ncbi:hypothetical protein [Methylomonas fluvii]|uniref:Uncharacterized protein n=1 Tax=Methylomonas fluvii TaxID=1854564 RepID=A0ABR9DD67_9GAMM|nr:hypothetical protein [Methylomonas fluvii]MBD9360233.1 hypothetical protein [Methylomonas fluvii]
MNKATFHTTWIVLIAILAAAFRYEYPDNNVTDVTVVLAVVAFGITLLIDFIWKKANKKKVETPNNENKKDTSA